MAQELTNGTLLQCSFGALPSALQILPINRVMSGGQPAANIADMVPMLNILPFGMCISLANPTVAVATAAALGVLTPMPCIPVPAGPWVTVNQRENVGGLPTVDLSGTCTCAWGGLIRATVAAQFTVAVG
jgi:hypothetical protein